MSRTLRRDATQARPRHERLGALPPATNPHCSRVIWESPLRSKRLWAKCLQAKSPTGSTKTYQQKGPCGPARNRNRKPMVGRGLPQSLPGAPAGKIASSMRTKSPVGTNPITDVNRGLLWVLPAGYALRRRVFTTLLLRMRASSDPHLLCEFDDGYLALTLSKGRMTASTNLVRH